MIKEQVNSLSTDRLNVTDSRPVSDWSVELNGDELVIEFDRTTHEIIWAWESETRVHFRIVKRTER